MGGAAVKDDADGENESQDEPPLVDMSNSPY
jgi:hypothetical protein